jgi:hypothetical protein
MIVHLSKISVVLILVVNLFAGFDRYDYNSSTGIAENLSISGISRVIDSVRIEKSDEGKISPEDSQVILHSYDSNGALNKVVYIFENGNEIISRTFQLNEHNKIIKDEAVDADGKTVFLVNYEYDSLNRIIRQKTITDELTEYDKSRTGLTLSLYYDSLNHLISQAPHYSNRRVSGAKTIFKYDDHGRICNAIDKSENGIINKVVSIIYDPCNYLRQIFEYDKDGELKKEITITYNSAGFLEEIKIIRDPEEDAYLIEQHNFTYEYLDNFNKPEVCTSHFAPLTAKQAMITDTSLYQFSFSFSQPVKRITLDRTRTIDRNTDKLLLPAGKHTFHYYSHSGMINKQAFFLYENDSMHLRVKKLRITAEPAFSFMTAFDDFTANITSDFGVQLGCHCISGTVGYGGSTSSSETEYFLLGGGYQVSIPLNTCFFITAGFNALCFLGTLGKERETEYEVYYTEGADVAFGPKVGFHAGTPLFNGHLFVMPLFGMESLYWRFGCGFGLTIGPGW